MNCKNLRRTGLVLLERSSIWWMRYLICTLWRPGILVLGVFGGSFYDCEDVSDDLEATLFAWCEIDNDCFK